MRTLTRILLSLLLVGAIGVVALLFTDFSSPRLARALIDLAASRGGVELEVEEARLNLRKGLLLEGVTASSDAGDESLEVSVDRLVLEHRLWPLLRGQVVVERLVLDAPRIDMVSALPAGPTVKPRAEPPPTGGVGGPGTETDSASRGRLHLEIGEMEITDGRLSSTTSGSAGSTVLNGLDLVLREIAVDASEPSLPLAVSGRGWLEAESLSVDEYRLNGIAAALEADRGRLRLAEFESSSSAGELLVEEIDIDLAQDPYRYRVSIEAESIDLNHILDLPGGIGPARLELRGNGEGPGMGGAVAEMTIWIDQGTLPSVALLDRIDRLVGTALDRAAYEALDLRLSLADDVLEIDPVEVVTEVARLDLSGSIELGGGIDLRAGVGIPRETFTASDVSDDVLDALTRRGWLTIPLHVTGTVDDPRFAPDMEVIKERTRWLAEQTRDSLRSRFSSQLGGMIRRRVGR